MSRLAKKPIEVSKNVEVKLSGNLVSAKGPKGTLELQLPEGIKVTIEDGKVHVSLVENVKIEKSMLGLYRSLLKNIVLGVANEFEKKLQLVGVGYRAAVKGNNLDLQLGFSHPLELPIPQGLSVSVQKNTLITVMGIDKQLVGHFSANIRSKRPPEPYKGKGVRYVDEHVRKKAGKTAKGK